MTVHFGTPYCPGNIGKGLNDFCKLVPGNDWICLRDQDTLLFDGSGQLIYDIAAQADKENYSLVGCLTNRLRAPYQCLSGLFSEVADIHEHIKYNNFAAHRGAAIKHLEDGAVAGMFMLFRKSTWAQNPFHENSIYFDKIFTADIRKAGGKVGIAQGLYVFHLYRFGAKDPFNSVNHLQNATRKS